MNDMFRDNGRYTSKHSYSREVLIEGLEMVHNQLNWAFHNLCKARLGSLGWKRWLNRYKHFMEECFHLEEQIRYAVSEEIDALFRFEDD